MGHYTSTLLILFLIISGCNDGRTPEQTMKQIDGATWFEMFALAESLFFIKGEDIRFSFKKNENGDIVGFTLHSEGIELPGEKL